MKAFYFTVPILLATFLLGCTEQSPLAGPATSNSKQILTKPFDGIPVDEIIIAPNGAKFNVSGLVVYQYSIEGEAGVLYTNVNLTIGQSGDDKTWMVSGEGKTYLKIDEQGVATSKESHSMLTTIGRPSREYGFEIDYRIEEKTVSIEGMEIQLLAAAYAQVTD